MCGFFITNNPNVKVEHENLVEELLRFRGPDYSSGFVFHKGWIAYHSRLSIIDLEETSNQPIIDDCGGLLVFNGEILNYKELGFRYFSCEYKSDTKLLSDLLKLNLLNLNELDGFFSFVYINNKGEMTHAVRDFFGVKPLYYYLDEINGYYALSSEPIVLKKIFSLGVNKHSIDEYYATRAPIFSGSFFDKVKSVEPGSCLLNGVYFDLLDYIQVSYENVELSLLKDSLLKGIGTRMVSDAPVGLLLSKGIDSNLINSLSSFDYKYSIGFSADEDICYLKNKSINNLKIFECTSDEYREAFSYLLELRGEPMSVPNEILLYLVAKEARKDGVKVLLSGEGADEFFGGYDRIFNWALSSDHFDIDKFLSLYCYSLPEKNSILFSKFEKIFNNVERLSCFEKVRWFFIRYHMPVLFRRLDFSLMAAGVEGREPIANMHTFIRAIKIEPAELMYKELGKNPLRKLISPILGRGFAYERKVGFPVDMKKIFPCYKKESSYEIWFNENMKVLEK